MLCSTKLRSAQRHTRFRLALKASGVKGSAQRRDSVVSGQRLVDDLTIRTHRDTFIRGELPMTTKLTLSVDKRVVQRAKLFARTQKQSLSQIVTSYLDRISRQVAGTEDIDPEVMELSDRIKLRDLPDLKDAKYRYLKEKYIHD